MRVNLDNMRVLHEMADSYQVVARSYDIAEMWPALVPATDVGDLAVYEVWWHLSDGMWMHVDSDGSVVKCDTPIPSREDLQQ